MRIRRRPQASLQTSSDPSTFASPQTSQNAATNRECVGEEARLHANADLGGQKSVVARRLELPQDNAGDSGRSVGAGPGAGGLHMRFSVANGHHSSQQGKVTCNGAVGGKSEPVVAEHAASNGVEPPVAVKDDGEKVSSNGIVVGGANKKRRGPPVLLEGSRCSRVNGRGWRCSQPTLVGYSLCEHHLGKGRARSAAAAAAAAGGGGGARGGPGQLGRTEHRPRIPAAAGAVTVAAAAAAPSAEGPSLPQC
ncbi:hypothetical protein EJB05_45764 [Eragrostis curvula]|uniref:WRC domain-containing protein n=1 Tax=Eragrostis curvula TaxID=38414 RepID=A0A5J9TL16_9POAL|nr:hypothetical protein EJB05_45764 [Eragrostis curvula]